MISRNLFERLSETGAIYNTAKKFWSKVRVYLEKANPQLKLFKEL
jgi:hypothetical protein